MCRERLWVVVELKRRYRNSLNEWKNLIWAIRPCSAFIYPQIIHPKHYSVTKSQCFLTVWGLNTTHLSRMIDCFVNPLFESRIGEEFDNPTPASWLVFVPGMTMYMHLSEIFYYHFFFLSFSLTLSLSLCVSFDVFVSTLLAGRSDSPRWVFKCMLSFIQPFIHLEHLYNASSFIWRHVSQHTDIHTYMQWMDKFSLFFLRGYRMRKDFT